MLPYKHRSINVTLQIKIHLCYHTNTDLLMVPYKHKSINVTLQTQIY